MQHKLMQHCIMISCNNYQLTMPPSSLPRLPCEEEDSEPYSLIVVVRSGKVELQHKASCYRGHDYSNRLNSLQGFTTIQPARSDLQGGEHLARERSTKAIRPCQPILGSTK